MQQLRIRTRAKIMHKEKPEDKPLRFMRESRQAIRTQKLPRREHSCKEKNKQPVHSGKRGPAGKKIAKSC